MKKKVDNPMIEAAEECLAEEVAAAKTVGVKNKLKKFADACRTIVEDRKTPLTIRTAACEHNARFPKQSLSEQTIRNQRSGGNPYMAVFRAWERAALATAPAPANRAVGGQILRESDLHLIKDPLLRHQILQVFVQNRSLHNMLNILKVAHGRETLQLRDAAVREIMPGGEGLILTGAEIEAVKDFIDPRKLKAKHLKRSESDGVATIDGETIADPGFMSALTKIVKSYELPNDNE